MIGHVRLSRALRFAGISQGRRLYRAPPIILDEHSRLRRPFALRGVLGYHRNRPNLQLTPRFSKGTGDEPGILGSFRGNGAADGRL